MPITFTHARRLDALEQQLQTRPVECARLRFPPVADETPGLESLRPNAESAAIKVQHLHLYRSPRDEHEQLPAQWIRSEPMARQRIQPIERLALMRCTALAQTGQALDVHHRPGNVHDSNGAETFIGQCFAAIRAARPAAQLELETRMDSAFFSDAIIEAMAQARVQFTVSVPFERFPPLKEMIEQRRRWRHLDDNVSYFETSWKPKSWDRRHRFLFIRKRVNRQNKAPLQLDLFVPHEEGYDFKVIVTNKRVGARHVVAFHEGRGAQEGIFAELKSHCHLDYVPVKTLAGNQTYLLAGLFAHNLGRELQMTAHPPQRRTTAKRTPLWAFEKLGTLQRKLIQRAGRLLRPAGKLVLSMNANEAVENEMSHYLDAVAAA